MYSSEEIEDFFNANTSANDDVGPLAYVRPVSTPEGSAFGVFSADGAQLAVFDTREAAFFAAKQHDLDPVLIH